MPTIKIEEDKTRNTICVLVDGDPSQGQPWRIDLSADSAYMIGNSMSLMALKLGSTSGSPCTTITGPGNQKACKPLQPQGQMTRQRPFVEKENKLVGDSFDPPTTTVETTIPSPVDPSTINR